MALEASTLTIKVQSDGIESNTAALEKLAAAGDKAEKSTAKLSQSNKAAEASAKQQEKLWYDLLDKASKYYEKQWNTQQKALERENKAAEDAILREATAMNRAWDKKVADLKSSQERFQKEIDKHYAQQAKAQAASEAQLQRQADKYYADKIKAAEKALAAETRALAKAEAERSAAADRAYAAMQAEANRMNRLYDQEAAKAEATAMRQARMNAGFATASSGSRLGTVQQAVAYGQRGGNVAEQYGSEVAAMANAHGLAQLSEEHRRLQQASTNSRQAVHAHTESMADAHAMARGLSGSLGALWLTYGNVLPLVAGAAIGASIKEAVTGFTEVQYQMTFMKALTEDTTNSVGQLTDQMHKVAGELGISPDAAAKGLRALAQAGLTTTDALKTLPAAFKLATVGELPLESAALAGISVLNAYGVSADRQADSFEHVGDVMAKAGAMSAASVASMAESFKYSAGTAEQYGVSLEKLATVMTMLGKRSITGSSAGVASNNLIAEVYSPSSEKAIKAQAALGVHAYADGVRQSLEDVIQQIKDGLKKYDAQSQGILLEAMFGKKGGKAFYAVANESKEAFLQMEDDLAKSSGFTANVYSESLKTVRGQIDLTKSAITNMFSTIGEEADTPLKHLMQTVRQIASSDGVKDAFIGLAQSIKTLVNVGVPAAAAVLGTVWASMKVGTLVMGLFNKAMLEVIVMNAAKWFYSTLSAVMALTQGVATMNLAMIATNPIFMALAGAAAVLGGAYLIFKRNKESVLELHEQEMKNAKEAQDAMEKDITIMEKKLELQKKGVAASEMDSELRKADARSTQDKIRQQILDNNAAIADKAKKVYGGEAQRAVNDSAINALRQDNQALTKALDEQEKIIKREEEMQQRRKQIQESMRLVQVGQDLAAEGQGTGPLQEGSKKYDPKADKAAQKLIDHNKQEVLELNRSTAAYEAKTKAMLESFRAGEKIAAESQQAKVEVNRLAGDVYGNTSKSNPLYQNAMAAAKRNDDAKAVQDRVKDFNEFVDSLRNAAIGEKEFERAADEENQSYMGNLEKKAQKYLQNAQLTKNFSADELAQIREMARAQDEANRQSDAAKKMRDATGSSKARAQEAAEEADAMVMFGTKTHATAIEIAKAAIAKAQLTSKGYEATIANRMEAAATEQLNAAYVDLVKNQLALDVELDKAKAESLTLFGQSEAEKVRIVADTQRKIADLEMANAQAAFDEKALNGTSTFTDVVKINQAQAAYAKTLKTLKETSEVKLKNLEIKDQVDQWKTLGKTIEDAFTKGFGKAGAAAGKMFNLFAQGESDNLKYANQIAAVKASTTMDEATKARELAKIQDAMAISRISQYGDMADAAKGFFDENSKGYEAMAKAAQVLHAAEVALSLVKGVNAILTQGEGDPYSAPARMAAMAAMVAALGVAISGGGGGGMSVADQQKVQGTGTVLGSEGSIKDNKVELIGAKSESITKSLSILEKNSGLGLVIDDSMLVAMRTLSNSIAKLAANVVRDSGISNPDVNLNTNNGFASTMLKSVVGLGIGFIIPAIGNLLGKVATSIFGGKQTLENSGFSINQTTLASAAAGGVDAVKFADIKTSGGWFSGDKHDHKTESLGASVNNQFSMVFANMRDTLNAAAKSIGVGGDAFTNKLNSFVIDVGNISLKGMTGDQIEKEIQSMFSKVGDQMTSFAFSDLTKYQKVGEGLLETVSRVANELGQVKDAFAVLGQSIPKGMAGVEFSQKIIDAAGGIDVLTGGVGKYMQSILTDDQRLAITTKSVNDAMGELNLSQIKTKAQFKDMVDQATIGMQAGNDAATKLFFSLMNIAPAFGQMVDGQQKVADGFKSTVDSMKSFIESIKNFRQSLIMGNLSNLTPEQKLAQSKSYYDDILSKAMHGDTTAQGKVTDAAQAYLEASRVVNASSSAYDAAFQSVQKQMVGLEDYAGTQLTDAQKQIDALNNINATAVDILNVLQTGGATTPTQQPQGGVSEKTVQMISDGLHTLSTKMHDVLVATVNTNANNAEVIADSVSKSTKAIVASNKSTVIQER